MSTKHTPGPWVIDENYLSEVQTSSLLTVATCWHEHTAGQTINVTGVLECSLEESAANARLIAAAPDLLRFAEKVRDYARETDDESLFAAADDLISKATTE